MLERGEINIIRQFIKEGDLVFDIGACEGLWTLEALKRGSTRIHAFEPILDSFMNLKNIFRPTSVFINQIGMSDICGERTFYTYPASSGLSTIYRRSSIEKPNSGLDPIKFILPVTTIDRYCFEHKINKIDFIKIDVEGSELDVLYGASEMLSQINCIQFEYGGTYIDAHITFKEVYDLLSKHNYEIFKILTDSLQSVYNNIESYKYSNFLAIKKDLHNV